MKIIDKRFHAERNLELESQELLDELAHRAAWEPLLLSVRSKYTRTPGAFIERLKEDERQLLRHLKNE